MTDGPPDAKPGRRLRIAAISAIGGLVMRLLGMTWRVRREGEPAFDDMLARGEPFIVVFWHEQILPVSWIHRHRGMASLISRHADGEIIARIAERLGYQTVRGSSSRGAVRALLEAEQRVNEGIAVGFTPDGPRGPRRVFAPGALIVAQRTGRPVVAIGATASRAWRLKSWDRHLVPKPFATVTVRYSQPQFVQAADAREAALQTPTFQALLSSLSDEQ
jgi:lysophospholipid acyltransferase (LPLAT)-like uncharacterized protein